MKKPVKIFYLFSVFLLIILMVDLFARTRAYGDSDYMEALSIVRFDKKIMAQNFILKDLDGHAVSLEDYRGKIVMLNFWATWCPPCRDEMPSMEKLYDKFKNEDFTILAIDLQEDVGPVKNFKEQYKLNFPILLDSDGNVGKFYNIRAIPTTYLVDRQGYLVGVAMGPRDWAAESAFMLIDQLLQMPSPS